MDTSLIISIISLGVSLYALWKSNKHKEKEFEYKDRELADKELDRKAANKSRLKTHGGSSGYDGEIIRFKNMDNKIRMVDIEFKVNDGLTIRDMPHVYKDKIIEKDEEIQLNYPRGNYQGNMDEIHLDIKFYFTDMINTPYKQRYRRQDKKSTFDEIPIEVKDYDEAINKFRN